MTGELSHALLYHGMSRPFGYYTIYHTSTLGMLQCTDTPLPFSALLVPKEIFDDETCFPSRSEAFMGSSPVVQALKLGARENPSVKIVSNPGAPSSTSFHRLHRSRIAPQSVLRCGLHACCTCLFCARWWPMPLRSSTHCVLTHRTASL